MYIVAGFLGVFVIAAVLTVLTLGAIFTAPGYRGPASDHFNGKVFSNYDGVKSKGFGAVLRWAMDRQPGTWQEDTVENYGKHPLSHFKEGLRITFVNHSTFLIQVDGINILTDPVWSKRVSPVSWAGPRRMRMPGIRFEDLPPIHVVAISHNHYDHLDENTLRWLAGGHHPAFVVPLGVKAFLDKRGFINVAELDWWQKQDLGNGVTIQAVPAQHFSGRGMFDRDATLWCGFLLRTSAGNIYFAGDTGYNERMFRDIATEAGEIHVAMLPIGAYKPEWFMSPIHTSPLEAVRIHKDLRAKNTIAIHFGTFPLADDGAEDPVNDLRSALETLGVPDEEFIVMKEGDYRVFD